MNFESLVEQIAKEVYGKINVGGGAAPSAQGRKITPHEIAKMMDYSLLKPELTKQQVVAGCLEAVKYDCKSVCVRSADVLLAMEICKNSDVFVKTVVGFPHGNCLPEVKNFEAQIAIAQGCKEIDMVMNIGMFKSGEYDIIAREVKMLAETCHTAGCKLQVIMENAYLTKEEIAKACRIIEENGGDFVKTSTGFAPGGATVEDLKIMRATVSPKVNVKAAGGVRTLDAALAVAACGSCRFGCTATKKILEEAVEREKTGALVVPPLSEVPDNAIGY